MDSARSQNDDTAAQFSQFFVIAPPVNPIEDNVFQDRKVRIRFYAHNNWNHHLVTASQAMVESRKQSLGPQAQPGADTGHCGGPPQTDSLLYPLGLCLPLFIYFLLYFTTFLHRSLQRGYGKANL